MKKGNSNNNPIKASAYARSFQTKILFSSLFPTFFLSIQTGDEMHLKVLNVSPLSPDPEMIVFLFIIYTRKLTYLFFFFAIAFKFIILDASMD